MKKLISILWILTIVLFSTVYLFVNRYQYQAINLSVYKFAFFHVKPIRFDRWTNKVEHYIVTSKTTKEEDVDTAETGWEDLAKWNEEKRLQIANKNKNSN